LPTVELADGLKVTFLSPDRRRLDDLQRSWQTWHDKEAQAAEVPRGRVVGLEAFGRKPMPDPLDIERLAAGAEQIDSHSKTVPFRVIGLGYISARTELGRLLWRCSLALVR